MFLKNRSDSETDFKKSEPKFYGRRKGRTIRKAKSSLMDNFLPHILIKDINENMFGLPVKEIHLEIGFGDGQHIAGQAKNNPDIGFIGAEVFENGVANLLSLITGIKEGKNLPEKFTLEYGRIDNIRVFNDDIRLLFKKIPDSFLSRVYVLFPDPWPKKRHSERRIINQDNLKEISRILKKDGILRIATDHKIYKGWTLHQLSENKSFHWTAQKSDDWRKEPIDWVKTKYQEKALREGRKPIFLDFKKI